MSEAPLQRVLRAFPGATQRGRTWRARCGAHDDMHPSVDITVGRDGVVLVVCRSGCPTEAVLAAHGLQWRDLFPGDLRRNFSDPGELVAVYDYYDTAGSPAFQVVRFQQPSGEKTFRQRRPGGPWGLGGVKPCLYRLPQLLEAVAAQRRVFIPEGEKDVDNLARRGLAATTNPMGAGKWRTEYSEALAGAEVALLPDNDTPGREHAQQVARSLCGKAKSIKMLALPGLAEKGDVSNWLAAGGTAEELQRLAEAAPEWQAPERPGAVAAEEAAAAGNNAGEPSPGGSPAARNRWRSEGQPTAGWTKALADGIEVEARFAQDGGGMLFRYADGSYRPDGEAFIQRRVKELLEEWARPDAWSTRRANEVVEYIRVSAPLLWERPPLDTVNVENGLLSVHTRELRPHSPDFLSPVQLPVRFDPEATCPAWEKFVAEVFPKDAQEVAFELPALLMRPDTRSQKATLLDGEGANGKSTYLAALRAFLGRRNCAAISLHKLEQDKFSVARLFGRLANICADLPSAHLAGTSIFKALTGGDEVDGEHKFKSGFGFTPYARLVFSSNFPPRSPDGSVAFFRRWNVIPFEKTFEEGAEGTVPRDELDACLADPKELSGVLNRALEVLPRLERQGGLTESESMRAAGARFRAVTDPVAVWLDQNTIEGPECLVSKQDLVRAYNATAAEAGRPLQTANGFGRLLQTLRLGLREAQRTHGGRERVWCWLGIGLRESAPSTKPPPGNQNPGSNGNSPDLSTRVRESERAESQARQQENRENPVTSGIAGTSGVQDVHAAPRTHMPEWDCRNCGESEWVSDDRGGWRCGACTPAGSAA